MASKNPTIEDIISLKFAGEATISPDKSKIAYTVNYTNWAKNEFNNYCMIYFIEKKESVQLTTCSVQKLQWLNSETLAVLREGQIWIYDQLIDEGTQLTFYSNPIIQFKVAGKGILFLSSQIQKKMTERLKKFGNFIRIDKDDSEKSTLFYFDIDKLLLYNSLKNSQNSDNPEINKPLIEISSILKSHLNIKSFVLLQKEDLLFLNCFDKNKNSTVIQISINLESILNEFFQQEKAINDKINNLKLKYLKLPQNTLIDDVSFDEKFVLLRTGSEDRSDIIIPDYNIVSLTTIEDLESWINITKKLDLYPNRIFFGNKNVIISYPDRGTWKIALIDNQGNVKEFMKEFSTVYPISKPQQNEFMLALVSNENSFEEIYFINLKEESWIKITSFGDQVQNWNLGSKELISWTSKDGTQIEGILSKPNNFSPKKKYPLLIMVHGGPASMSEMISPDFTDLRLYPTYQFLNEGILILKPNYRGSIGYGKKFKNLNKENIGIGDLWDIESGIDKLINTGFIDDTRIGCCGWSQGGYISAFVATHSSRFLCVSIGAGISDWFLFYLTSNYYRWTLDFIGNDPFNKKIPYDKSSALLTKPIRKTPALIQHGAKDKGTTIVNATALYKAFKNANIQVEFILYPEMEHGPQKPILAKSIMHQNFVWFTHFFFDSPLVFD